MKQIVLSRRNGRAYSDAFYRVLVHGFFPNAQSRAEREQVLILVHHEIRRWKQLGTEAYHPSTVSAKIAESIEKKLGHHTVCGYVGLVLILLEMLKLPVSLDRAAKIVSELSYAAKDFRWYSLFGRSPTIKSIRAIGDISDIKRVFREYKSTAHIHTSRLICGEYIETLPLWERSPEAEGCFLSTVAHVQHFFSDLPIAKDWDMWDVIQTLPDEVFDFPPLFPSPEMIDHIALPSEKNRPEVWQPPPRGGISNTPIE